MSEEQPTKPPKIAPSKATGVNTAFDTWLERGLHRLFDDIAQEPIPDALLKIIDAGLADRE